MSQTASPLIHANQLAGIKGNAVFIDARSGADAIQRYSAGHYPGALHIDLDADLSRKADNAAHGGRHPLPPVDEFGKLLGHWGITPDSVVIAYDDKNGANAAARFWWMLRAVGHANVYMVDGGLDAIIREKINLEKGIVSPTAKKTYPVTDWSLPIVTMNEVERATQSTEDVVMDVREAYRYRGEKEPIDLVAGHIPGAINFPYIDNLNPDGTFRPANNLRQDYLKAIDNREIDHVIVHCGSGVTACHTLLALEHAGLEGAKLYVGSWSEWSRNDKPIATELK